MGAYRDENKNGTWYCKFSYNNWQGKKITKKKRGFKTKKEALAWENSFLEQQAGNIEMSFEDFFEVYKRDLKNKLREHTWMTKENIVKTKIMPYFKNLSLNEIENSTIMAWHNELLSIRDEKGRGYSMTYLRTIHAQLSSILNHACKYYNLRSNPCRAVGTIGEKEAGEMLFWTQEEYEQFIEAVKDKPKSFYAFEILYWCGLRTGELLALTPRKFDFERNTIRVDESLQRLKGKNVITAPKTKKSIRTVMMPEFIAVGIKDYLNSFYKIGDDDLIFDFTKSFLHHEMDRGCRISGVKRIRVHDLRHSHVSLLIEQGFSAIAIADRVGHESIDITFRYAHLFPTKQLEMVNSLESLRPDTAKDKWKELLKDDE